MSSRSSAGALIGDTVNWKSKVGFLRRGESGVPGENLSVQSREPTNSTHIWRRVRESNPGHIGGRRVLSPLRHPCILEMHSRDGGGEISIVWTYFHRSVFSNSGFRIWWSRGIYFLTSSAVLSRLRHPCTPVTPVTFFLFWLQSPEVWPLRYLTSLKTLGLHPRGMCITSLIHRTQFGWFYQACTLPKPD